VSVRAWIATTLALALLALARPAAAADPEALWKIVHDKCAPNEAAKGDPAPCLAVDLAGGYAVLKDLSGATQVLTIPTARATGIESAALLAPHAPNYWADAWAARRFVEQLAGRTISREDLGLALNSIDGRSQNQLHIHVDCLQPEVKAALALARNAAPTAWSSFSLTLEGHPYQAIRLSPRDLERRNLFRLLAARDPATRNNMGLQTLVLAGVTFEDGAPGFILLSGAADPETDDRGSGEELLDHSCKVLAPAA
jgi:CDP-diacylglycerol pyrophosphatase